MNTSIFWDITEPLSYNALFNFIVGERGNGKSYGVKKYVISRFLKTGKQFGYVRRYKEEYKDSANTFFDDIVANNEFPNHEFEVKGREFLIDGKVAGHGFVLSTATKKKSMSFPYIETIMFDEFLLDPDKPFDRYLGQEVDAFLNLYETIARLREVKVFFVANAFTWQNPYFLYWDIKFPKNKRKIKVTNDILIQVTESVDYRDVKSQSRFGRMMKDTEFSRHAVNNEFIRDTEDFVITKPDNLDYFFTIISNGRKYGVWRQPTTNIIFVSESYNPTFKIIFTTMENHEPNTLLFKGAYKSSLLTHFMKTFKMGGVFYDSIKTKNMVIKMFAKL